MKYLILLAALLGAACTQPGGNNTDTHANVGTAGAASGSKVFAITGGTVYTLGKAGKIEHGTVLIRDGKIAEVGPSVKIPEGAVRIDATGKIVTPGIFDPDSTLGVVEVSAVETTRDASSGDSRFSAAFDIADAINPRSVRIPVQRIAGVTRAMVSPRPGTDKIISGQGVIMDLSGSEGFIHRDPAAMFAVLGESGKTQAGGSRAAALAALREALRNAQTYGGTGGAHAGNQRPPYPLSRKDIEALRPVVEGKLPLVVNVNRASDIVQALDLARDFNVKLIVFGGAEAWMVANRLAAAHVPVILNPLEDLPAHFETLGATMENAARLQKAGVLIAFVGSGLDTTVLQAAGNAVAYGLPWIDALKALMLNPARIYGVADHLGTLEQGKAADVVIWSGDPLQFSSHPVQVFIAGRKIRMVSRQTLLRDRYLTELRNKGAIPAAYIKPQGL